MLKRRILAPIRFVFPSDSAVDESSDYEAYVRERCNWDHIKLVDGEAPTVFVLRGLKHKERIAVDHYTTTMGRHSYVVRCALTGVENYTVDTPDGAHVAGAPERDSDGLVSEAYFAALALTLDDIAALSTAALALSEASDPLFGRLAKLLGGAE